MSRYSTGLRALFRDGEVMMQPTMIALPSLPALFFLLPLPLSLASSALSKLCLFIPFHKRSSQTLQVPPPHLFAYKTEPPTQPLCSQAIHNEIQHQSLESLKTRSTTEEALFRPKYFLNFGSVAPLTQFNIAGVSTLILMDIFFFCFFRFVPKTRYCS